MGGLQTQPALDPMALRADFPILSTKLHSGVPLAYLDNAATTQHPRQVIQALVDTYEQHYANVHRGIHWLSDQSTDLYEEARSRVATFINSPSKEQVIFTRGTTESVNLVAHSWGDANVGEGDEILVTEMEHHSNIVPWQQLAERTGAVVRWAPITDQGLLCLDSFSSLLTDRTKLVAVAGISNVLGTANPLQKIIDLAHAAGALVLVDMAQSVAHSKTDVQLLDVDFGAFSGHKMLAPSGIGVLYGRRELLEAMPPFQGGGSMIRRVTTSGFTPGELPAKFEAGTPPIVPAIGFTAAIDYLDAVGMEAIATHERQLTIRTHELLQEIDGVRILGPSPQEKSGIVSFTLEGIHAHDVAQILDRQGLAVRAGHHCAQPLHKRLGIGASTRASFYLYNTMEEVETLAAAIHEVKRIFRRA